MKQLSVTAQVRKIVILYAAAGILWILLSDTILYSLAQDADLAERLQNLKGVLFVLVTSTVLLSLLRKEFGKRASLEADVHLLNARLTGMLDAIDEAFLLIDSDDCLVLSNPAAERILGCAAGSTGTSYPAALRGEALALVKNVVARIRQGERSVRFERQLRGDGRWLLLHAYATDHSVALFIDDITLRKQQEQQSRTYSTFLELSAEAAKLGFVEWPEGAESVSVSRETRRLFGLEGESESIPTNDLFSRVYAEDGERCADMIASLRNGVLDSISFTTRITAPGEAPRWLLCRGRRLDNGTTTPGSIFIAAMDITWWKTLEEDLRAQRALLQQTFDTLDVAVILVDTRDGHIHSANPAVKFIFGYAVAELIGTPSSALYPSERAYERFWLAANDALMETDRFSTRLELRHKDGSLLYAEQTVSALFEHTGRPLRMCVVRDITSSVNSEARQARLQRQRDDLLERFEAHIQRMPFGYIVTDSRFLITYVNPAAEAMFGYSRSELVGRNPYEIIVPQQSHAALRELQERWLRGELTAHGVLYCAPKHGSHLICDWFNTPHMTADGTFDSLVTIVRDVTADRMARQALLESEKKYRDLFEKSPVPMWIYDIDTLRMRTVNGAALGLYGYSEERFLQMTLHDLHPDDGVEVLKLHLESRERRDNFQGLSTHVRKDGSILEVEITSRWIPFENGDARLVLVNDVTEKLRVQRALRESEQRFRSLFSSAGVGIALIDPDSLSVVDCNPEICRILCADRDDLLGRSLDGFTYPELFESYSREWEDVSQRNWPRLQLELPVLRPDGVELWGRLTVSVLRSDTNHEMFIIAMLEDISQRRKAEEELRASEERFSHVFRANPAASLITRMRDGMILEVNERFSEMYGLPAEDIVGRRTIELGMWADETQRDEMLEQLRAGNDIDALNVRFRKASGDLRDALAAFKRTRIAGEDCIVSLVQDVTERENYLRAVQANREELRALNIRLQQVREEERMKLARDLHDALGQSLTGLKMDLAYIRKIFGGDEGPQEATDSIRRMMGVLDGTISSVRNIAMELRPGMVDDLGLAESIRWYANEFSKRSQLPVSVRVRNAPELLSPDHALSLFRIAQEALTNIARHASATKVRIGLRANHGKLVLVVSDDGVGLEASVTTGKRALGIVGMRERATALGGRLTVRSRPGQGCTVRAEIPLPAPDPAADTGSGPENSEHEPREKDQA